MKEISVPKRLAFRSINGKAYIVDPENSILHELNATGTFIWELLNNGAEPKEIASALAREFDISSASAVKGVNVFIRELKKKDLLE